MQSKKPISVAFTSKFENIQNKLYIDINVSSKYSKMPNNGKTQIKALWDTGASMSAISKKLAEILELPVISMTKVGTAGGIVNANVHIIDIQLPNGDTIPDLHVVATDLVETNMLIGMDVITKGDFAISNFNGKTILNFRIPSYADINFVQMAVNLNPVSSNKKTKRNDLCPCGSGKKYKNCCGIFS